MATAGILDAQAYIFVLQKIAPTEIIDIAEKLLEAEKEPLVSFVINLEAKLFGIDNPGMSFSDIKDACEKQRHNIRNAIQRVKDTYIGEPRFASNVANFMRSYQFKPTRELIGIKE